MGTDEEFSSLCQLLDPVWDELEKPEDKEKDITMVPRHYVPVAMMRWCCLLLYHGAVCYLLVLFVTCYFTMVLFVTLLYLQSTPSRLAVVLSQS